MKIVLTAPATEMSEYGGNHAIAFGAGFPKPWFIPRKLLLDTFYTPVPRVDGFQAKYAPLGLRRIEASLIESGFFHPDDIAIVHPDDLEEAVGEDTRVVGIGAKDPLGLGYVSLTYSTLLGLGDPMNRYEFLYLMNRVRRLKRKYRFNVVLGGPGTWQITRFISPGKLGIDVVIEGEGEGIAPAVFAKLVQNEPIEKVVRGSCVRVEDIPVIRGASIYGAVEISRGCGRGCQFCTPTMQVKRSFPPEKILYDVSINLGMGQDKILLVTEDLYLYGSRVPWEPNVDAIRRLINRVTGMKRHGLRYLQVTHLNLATAYYRRDLTKWVAEKLYEFTWYKLNGRPVVTVEVGIETGSPRLIAKYMIGKPRPYKPEDWPRIVTESLIFMEEYDWVSLGTIIVGLPGETLEDALATLRLIEDIEAHGLRTFLVPLLFIPLGQSMLRDKPLKSFDELNNVQAEIFARCWRHNIRTWGYGFFASRPSLYRSLFRVLSRIYMYVFARRYWWRRIIAEEAYSELKRYL